VAKARQTTAAAMMRSVVLLRGYFGPRSIKGGLGGDDDRSGRTEGTASNEEIEEYQTEAITPSKTVEEEHRSVITRAEDDDRTPNLSTLTLTATDHHHPHEVALDNKPAPVVQSCSEQVSDPNKSPERRRSVSFGKLHVREFPVVLGDNPSVQFGGPPIRLDYDNIEQDDDAEGESEYNYTVLDLDDYERDRGDRRCQAELRVPAIVRRQWVGRDRAVERQVYVAQCQRRRTANAKTEWDDFYFAFERVQRGAVKKLGLQSRPSSQEGLAAQQWCQHYKRQEKQQQKQQQQLRQKQEQQKPHFYRQRIQSLLKHATSQVDPTATAIAESFPPRATTMTKTANKKKTRQDITAFFV
jgi:hypothetical protein